VQRKSSSPVIFIPQVSTLCPQIAAGFPQIMIVIHGLFTACPQTGVHNLRNILIAFADKQSVFNLIVTLAAWRA
jgi:hypothetical protein